MSDPSELSLIAELRRSVENKKRRNSTLSAAEIGENRRSKSPTARVQLSEEPIEQPSNVQLIEQPQRGQKEQRDFARSKQTTTMAAPWNHEIFDRLSKNMDKFEQQGNLMVQMQRKMHNIEEQLTQLGKRRISADDSTQNSSKKARVQLPLYPSFDSEQESDLDSDDEKRNRNVSTSQSFEELWPTSSEEEKSDGEISDDDMLADLQAAFQQNSETGPKLDKDFAESLNPKLRQMMAEETIKSLSERHKRPENFTNLQVPKSDKTVWQALQPHTKTNDAAIQKMLGMFGTAFVPIIKQMEIFNTLHKTKSKDIPVRDLRKLAQESYQLFCVAFTAANQRRRELFKSDLDSKFHKICEKDYPMSETDLFGNKLETELKDLDATKKIKLKKVNKTSFPGKKSSNYRDFKHNKPYYRDQGFHRGTSQNHKQYHSRGKKFPKSRQENNKKDKQ
ncbi:MAG: hypothetical protein AB2693_01255 [Candidatus Thiodiazotropha sp.]